MLRSDQTIAMATLPTDRRPATYEDLRSVPDDKVAEVVAGELHVSPRPAFRHARVSSSLGGLIGGPFDFNPDGPGGWWILDEPELHLGDDVLVPDLAGWKRERLPALPDVPWLELAPDWVCEVVSPLTARLDRTRKLPAYAASGVSHLWLIDPQARTLEVYRRTERFWTLVATHGGDEIVRAQPFEAVSLDLLVLWGESREPAP
jgi:Uma2 family endonuclease